MLQSIRMRHCDETDSSVGENIMKRENGKTIHFGNEIIYQNIWQQEFMIG